MVLLSKEFEGCDECGREQSQQRIDVTDMGKFIGVSKIANIPGQEKVTFMVGCQGQVERITRWITRHHHACDIGLDNLNDHGLNGDEGHCGQERNRLLLIGKRAILQFVEDGNAGHKLVCLTTLVPPRACLVASSHHLWFGAHFIIEAWDGCFNVDSRLHMFCYLCVLQKQDAERWASAAAGSRSGA